MSSTNDQRVGYPTLPTISTLTAEDDVANNATNGIAQERNEVSNNISNDSTHQTTSTERQLRSSGPPQDISLESIVEDRVTSEERHNEILRIVARGSDEALSNYDVGTKAEMLQVYRMLSSLVHPDKQTSILNEARDEYAAPGAIPEPEIGVKPGGKHKALWRLPRFVATVRRLHINADHTDAVAIAEETNKKIEEINIQDGLPGDCGKFPLPYLQYNYRSAHEILKKYRESDDAQLKANSRILFKAFSEATKDFCTERGLPLTWAWDCEDIDRLPEYLQGYEESENLAEGSLDQESSSNQGPSSNQEDAMNLDLPEILFKRNVFKRFQYLVRETSGFHVWKEEDECEIVNADQIPRIMKPDPSFIRNRKRQYKGIGWIAMPDGESITAGAGQYPPITLNVTWQDNVEDTPLWRSDVIKMIGKTKVEKDMARHVPHTKSIKYEGRPVTIMTHTADGLVDGERKAIDRILKDKAKALTAAQSAASVSGLPVYTNLMEPSILQPVVSQSAPVPQSVSTQSVPDQQGPVQSTSTQTAVPQPISMQQSAVQPLDLNNPTTQIVLQQLLQLLSQEGRL